MTPLTHEEFDKINIIKRKGKYEKELVSFMESGYPAAELVCFCPRVIGAYQTYKATANRYNFPISIIMRDSKIYAILTGQFGECRFKWFERLSYAVCGKYELPEDIEQTANDIMNEALTERQRSIIMLRFDDLLTLEEIAKKYGVSRERIRQIEAQSIRILRSPIYRNRWLIGNKEEDNVNKEIEKIKKDRRKELISSVLKNATQNEVSKIEDLDLSCRSYNCLLRNSDVKTLEDLLSKRFSMSVEEFYVWLMSIKGMGHKSAEEIMLKIDEFREENKNVG